MRREPSFTTSISTSTIDPALSAPPDAEGPGGIARRSISVLIVSTPISACGNTNNHHSRADQVLVTERFHGSRTAIAVYRNRHRRGLCAGRARLRADLPRHQRGQFRARRILDGRGLSDGGVRRRFALAVLAVVPAGAGRHGAIGRALQSRRLLSAPSPPVPA